MTSTTTTSLVFVTGATGYIASHIIDILVKRNYRVRACVRDSSNQSKLSFIHSLNQNYKNENKNKNNNNDIVEIVQGDLENADYETLFKDCTHIIHTATPYVHSAPDPDKDIVQPAINGTMRVLVAASKVNTIQKVIITSSGGAIVNSLSPKFVPKDEPYNEQDWNTTSTLTEGPYFLSKVLAEKAAWEYYEKNNTGHKFQLSVVCPTYVLGPPLNTVLNTSLKLYINMLFNAQTPFAAIVPVVDVRDVALAHVLVLESSQANGQRYLVGNTTTTWKKLVEIATTHPKLRDATTQEGPDKRINFNISSSQPDSLIKHWNIDHSKIESLGLTFHQLEDTIQDTILQLNNLNLLPTKSNTSAQ